MNNLPRIADSSSIAGSLTFKLKSYSSGSVLDGAYQRVTPVQYGNMVRILEGEIPTFQTPSVTDTPSAAVKQSDNLSGFEQPNEPGDTWQDNTKILLDDCPWTVRDLSGDRTGVRGREDLMGSLILTMGKMKDLLLNKPGKSEDTLLLNWMISHGAYVAWGNDGEACSVWTRGDRDGRGPSPIEGYPQVIYSDGRAAIRAAMRKLP